MSRYLWSFIAAKAITPRIVYPNISESHTVFEYCNHVKFSFNVSTLQVVLKKNPQHSIFLQRTSSLLFFFTETTPEARLYWVLFILFSEIIPTVAIDWMYSYGKRQFSFSDDRTGWKSFSAVFLPGSTISRNLLALVKYVSQNCP